jgi:hypothetical protein
VAQSRKRHWEVLNTVLAVNKKAAIREDGSKSVGYSYATWEQVKDFFPIVVGAIAAAPVAGISEDLLAALHKYLYCATVCIGSISQRVHFIAPIIITVCSHFGGQMQILADEEIEGHRVRARSRFDFVLRRGDKCICIVEAMKDDLLQGKTQCLVGCEALCDVEGLPVTYGIATNFFEWLFLKDEAHQVTEEMLVVALEDNRPTMDSLRAIANKIIAIME